jgi:hypothetical protein
VRTAPSVAAFVVAALLTVASVHSVQAAFEQRNPYDQAMEARRKSQWNEVVKLLTEAISLEAREQERSLRDDRLPHFYLGEAYYQLGNCARALTAWEESERQGVVRNERSSWKVLESGVKSCEEKGYLRAAEWTKAHAASESVIQEASRAETTLMQYKGEHRDVWNNELEKRQLGARTALDESRAKLNTGRASRRSQDFKEAADLANSARSNFAQLHDDLQRLVKNAADAAARASAPPASPAKSEIAPDLAASATGAYDAAERRVDRLNRGVRELPPSATLPSGFKTELTTLGGRLKVGRDELNAALAATDPVRFKGAADVPGTLSGRLAKLEAQLGALSIVPIALKDAADLFFSGQYEQAVAALTDQLAEETGAIAKPHFYAIRAAARMNLFEQGGRADESLRARAVEDVKLCKTLDKAFVPSGAAFSPRFRAFFDSINP